MCPPCIPGNHADLLLPAHLPLVAAATARVRPRLGGWTASVGPRGCWQGLPAGWSGWPARWAGTGSKDGCCRNPLPWLGTSCCPYPAARLLGAPAVSGGVAVLSIPRDQTAKLLGQERIQGQGLSGPQIDFAGLSGKFPYHRLKTPSDAVWRAKQAHCGGCRGVNMRPFHSSPTAGVLLLAPNADQRLFVCRVTKPCELMTPRFRLTTLGQSYSQ